MGEPELGAGPKPKGTGCQFTGIKRLDEKLECHVSNEKKTPGCSGDLLGIKPYPVKWGFIFINHEIWFLIKQQSD